MRTAPVGPAPSPSRGYKTSISEQRYHRAFVTPGGRHATHRAFRLDRGLRPAASPALSSPSSSPPPNGRLRAAADRRWIRPPPPPPPRPPPPPPPRPTPPPRPHRPPRPPP